MSASPGSIRSATASEDLLGIRDRISALTDEAERTEAEIFWRTLPETMAATLKHLDGEYGGTADYLRDRCGLTDEEIQTVRDRLLRP